LASHTKANGSGVSCSSGGSRRGGKLAGSASGGAGAVGRADQAL
jgi:hypothetical protein